MVEFREIRLKRRPIGVPVDEDFELASVPARAPGAGEAQVRNLFMSLDPAMRGRMRDVRTYIGPYPLGQPMEGRAVGQVTESADPALKPGDLVLSNYGWREGFTAPAADLKKLPADNLPPQLHLGILGTSGLTAYTGLFGAAGLHEGETVFVSGAAGAVGSAACQIAKLHGARVIASAGGPDKLAYLEEIGVDFPIDYKAEPDLEGALRDAVPEGFDVYFDNVGGDHLEAALAACKSYARFAMCGMISGYNDVEPRPGPRNMMQIVSKRLNLRGFNAANFPELATPFQEEMTGWLRSGAIRPRETVDRGIDAAIPAFRKLFSGANIGKMLVQF